MMSKSRLTENSVAFWAVVKTVMNNHSLEVSDKDFYNISLFQLYLVFIREFCTWGTTDCICLWMCEVVTISLEMSSMETVFLGLALKCQCTNCSESCCVSWYKYCYLPSQLSKPNMLFSSPLASKLHQK